MQMIAKRIPRWRSQRCPNDYKSFTHFVVFHWETETERIVIRDTKGNNHFEMHKACMAIGVLFIPTKADIETTLPIRTTSQSEFMALCS